MAGKRKVYTPEFKLAAVKMITEQKLSVAEVARRLGVSENRLHDWKKALAQKGADAFPGSGYLTPLEEENRRLRAEVKRLEMERDILKKLGPAHVAGGIKIPPRITAVNRRPRTRFQAGFGTDQRRLPA